MLQNFIKRIESLAVQQSETPSSHAFCSSFPTIPSFSQLPLPVLHHSQLLVKERKLQKITVCVSHLCQPSVTQGSLPLLFTSFVCATIMMQSVTHCTRTLFPHEGNTGKLCCSNFRIIKTMIANGTVPSWHKHGTVQPSQLNHPLLFPTTYWINVKQASESTF